MNGKPWLLTLCVVLCLTLAAAGQKSSPKPAVNSSDFCKKMFAGGSWMALFWYSGWIGIHGGQPKRFLCMAGMSSES